MELLFDDNDPNETGMEIFCEAILAAMKRAKARGMTVTMKSWMIDKESEASETKLGGRRFEVEVK